jgi:hypothetical protein
MEESPSSVTSVRTPDNILLATMLRDAYHLKLPQSYISKIEMLEYRVLPAVARQLCDLYGIDAKAFFAHWAATVPHFEPEDEGRVIRSDKGSSRL